MVKATPACDCSCTLNNHNESNAPRKPASVSEGYPVRHATPVILKGSISTPKVEANLPDEPDIPCSRWRVYRTRTTKEARRVSEW